MIESELAAWIAYIGAALNGIIMLFGILLAVLVIFATKKAVSLLDLSINGIYCHTGFLPS